ncbi:MAG: phage regulatory CII family protein [Pseudomonadota bacterium]|nr:phage regulatory CII family protein [Pseudomonadota bacterium]
MDRYTEGLREAAFEYGIKKLAYDLDMSEGRLYKKLDPDSGVSLTLADFMRITRTLGDVRCINRVLDDLGMVATPIPSGTSQAEADLRDLLLNTNEIVTALFHQVRVAEADGEIDAKERKEIADTRREVGVALNSLMQRIDAKHAGGKLRLAQ